VRAVGQAGPRGVVARGPGRFSPGSVAGAVNSAVGASGVMLLPGRGLQIPQGLDFGTWVSVGQRLWEMHGSSAWCLGDWLVYGETAYTGRYRDAIDQTSLDYQTLRNYAWVARRFALSRRRDSLSFGHHAEVASLPHVEQDFWLRKAEGLHWPVKRLRREVRASIRERSTGDSGQRGEPEEGEPGQEQDQPPAVRLQVYLSAEQMEACRAAADQAGLAVQAWAALVLGAATARYSPELSTTDHEVPRLQNRQVG
jgi:hypothetical protein